MKLPALQLPSFLNVEIKPGIFLLDEPVAITGTNKLRCLANVGGTLAVVELAIQFGEEQP